MRLPLQARPSLLGGTKAIFYPCFSCHGHKPLCQLHLTSPRSPHPVFCVLLENTEGTLSHRAGQ